MKLVRVVRRETALNPVARAVALASLRACVVEVQVGLHMWPDGANVKSEVLVCSQFLTLVMRALELQSDSASADYRVMAGANSALVQISQCGFYWRPKYAVSVDEGLRRALDVVPSLAPAHVKQAWAEMAEL